MGIERWYVAVVDGCRLMERGMAEPEFGGYLSAPGFFGPKRRQVRRDGVMRAFLAEVDAMDEQHPGIEGRIYTLDRYFDILHYLLSEPRRRGMKDGEDVGTWAIVGSRGLPEHLRGGQGHPVRYTPPGDVEAVATWLSSMKVAELRSAYAPVAMGDQGVYKFRVDGAVVALWDRIVSYFEGLRVFYVDVADHGEGVLAIVT